MRQKRLLCGNLDVGLDTFDSMEVLKFLMRHQWLVKLTVVAQRYCVQK